MVAKTERDEMQEIYDQALDNFARYLKRENLKMTRERRLILKEILNSGTHLEAEDLMMNFRKRGERVSRATIYRTFDLLLKAGYIVKSDFGQSHYHYEWNFGLKHHDHLICNQCGTVIEFSDPELEELQNKICSRHNFSVTSHTLQIFGLCSRCAHERSR